MSDEKRLRYLHRSRLSAWDVPPLREHEDQVVARVLATLRGDEPAPESHVHAIEEMGMCVECDAAAILGEDQG